ncbi:hypothetical protein OG883_05250 [Streptomyces sp. NBC_01142]|uniref:hypothetical protein n=1 Tax=Streptomyces sp. NBC_01142 TaxID=2975865 RepID=UPI00225C026D|nr:hypothetical protein [Streptomyces sp. NBC_01142]MCX4819319.1 hypothetical protein [Streptomyces sp. NBC_01142]
MGTNTSSGIGAVVPALLRGNLLAAASAAGHGADGIASVTRSIRKPSPTTA